MSILKLKDDFNDPGQNNTRKHVPLNPSPPPHPFCTRIRKESTILMRAKGLKALVNEDTLLRTHWAVQTGKHLLRTQNVSEQNQKHFLCPQQMLRARAKGGSICVGNNVSSFARAFTLVKAKGIFV